MTYNPPPSGWSDQPQYPGSGQPPNPEQPPNPGQPQNPGQPPYPGSGQPPNPGALGGPPAGWQTERKGFFGALFDFGFNHFVTPSIIKVLYVLGFVIISLIYLIYVVIAFSTSPLLGLGALLLGWIVPLLYLAFWRVMLEFFLAVVRMSEDVHHSSSRGL